MPTFSTDEVARVAALARIDLTPAELERLAGELEVIVHAVARVAEAVGDETPATSHPIPLTNVFREDVVEPSLPAEDVLAGAPTSEDGRFLVPQILAED
jgi:aspartyl-tRNA(Asn)/glutamyl-tRNA(Gln) amidotransferase subunit C